MITSHPSAPDGLVSHLTSYEPSHFSAGSVILCRNTAPLISFAYSLLHRNIPCRILGRDIGAALIALIKKQRAGNLVELRAALALWYDRELDRCAREDLSPERTTDQYQALLTFMNDLGDQVQDVESLLSKIELMFTDDAAGESTKVLLSTVHKAKGLEFSTVFILDFSKLMPSKFATQPWQIQQEKNLIYVAITRSMNTLHYINSDNWKEKEHTK